MALRRFAQDARSVWFGVACGLLASLLLATGLLVVRSVLPGTRTFHMQCGGASLHGTIWVEDSMVNALVSVSDPKRRKWRLTWKGYEDATDPNTLNTDNDSLSAASVAVLTDTDDGTHRTAILRPEGQSKTCAFQMHASRLW